MIALATYITLLMYFGFLFVYMDKIWPGLDRLQLYLCGVYPICDWSLFFISWCLQRNIMARRDQLFAFESTNVPLEKKQDDLFDVRYLPEEYMSDEQETDED